MADGYIRLQKNKRNEQISLAWHTAALTRCDKMPSLESLLTKESVKQSSPDMMAICKLLNAAYGGEEVET